MIVKDKHLAISAYHSIESYDICGSMVREEGTKPKNKEYISQYIFCLGFLCFLVGDKKRVIFIEMGRDHH